MSPVSGDSIGVPLICWLKLKIGSETEVDEVHDPGYFNLNVFA